MQKSWELEEHSPRSLAWMRGCWSRHLLPFFGKMKANKVSSATLRDYIERRKGQGASNASVSRELSILQSAFSLGYDENAAPRCR